MLLKVLFLSAVSTVSLLFTELFAKSGDEKSILPKQLIDVDGKTVDLAKLASEKKAVYCNLKSNVVLCLF